MARPRIKLLRSGIDELLHSQDVADFLMDVSEPVAMRAESDPNLDYAESIRHYLHHSPSRVTARVGASPVLGMAVEAKRGTLARALGEA